jgi:predicted AAA+ superfamily ATPase
MTVYKRPIYKVVAKRLGEPRRFIQVLAGPRQTGKTTLARQILADFKGQGRYATADEPVLKDRVWIGQQWETARFGVRKEGGKPSGLLVLDEVQKIPGWSETVKRLWDEDTAAGASLHVILLGSSPLLVQRGLSESLAGRFEIIHVTHWSLNEMREAFGWGLDQYLYYGGYPGAAALIGDHQRWKNYIQESLIETSVSRDVLLMTRVDKPALLRRLFELACSYSGQILSYQKMLGQLQDAGNTTTLAHYLQLLAGAGLVTGLSKYSGQKVRQRASSPKLLACNTALMSATTHLSFTEARRDTEYWGRVVETAAGASLINGVMGRDIQVHYWAAGNLEVDYVLQRGKDIVAIEVKSGRLKNTLPGMAAFTSATKVKKALLVGAQGIPLEDFLVTDPAAWFK